MRRWQAMKAFSLVELMIALLIMSILGMGISKYFKNSTAKMLNSQGGQESTSSTQRIQKRIRDDIQQAVFLNPSCALNPAPNVTVTTTCSSLKMLSGVVPFPGYTLDDMDALTNMDLPSNIEADVSSLTNDSDALRLVLYNATGSFNCRLNRDRSVNPLLNTGTGAGNEMIYADVDCASLIESGKLYALMEVFDNDTAARLDSDLQTFSNVFQITTLATSVLETTITASSVSNIYNQVGGLGLSGFSNLARIFPIKMVEWAFQPEGGALARGIYRREITPSSLDLTGKQDWVLVEPQAIGLQFNMMTNTPSGAVTHTRTMQYEANALSADYVTNNGVEDITGITADIVLQAETARSDGTTYDNPITSSVETSSYPVTEAIFQIELRNASSN